MLFMSLLYYISFAICEPKKILLLIVNIKSQEHKVGKISKYDAPKKAREILNLSNRVFSKSVKWLLFTDSLKNDGFQ